MGNAYVLTLAQKEASWAETWSIWIRGTALYNARGATSGFPSKVERSWEECSPRGRHPQAVEAKQPSTLIHSMAWATVALAETASTEMRFRHGRGVRRRT